MKKTWVFFKLRLLQLKYDKTALFFSYILPVLLLLGIGYPIESMNKSELNLHYIDEVNTASSAAFLEYIDNHPLIALVPPENDRSASIEKIGTNELKHLLLIDRFSDEKTSGSGLEKKQNHGEARKVNYILTQSQKSQMPNYQSGMAISVYSNDEPSNLVETEAIKNVLGEYFEDGERKQFTAHQISTDSETSYIITLLPGLIGMTLLIIGFNGFGGVLIEEKHEGIFKNIKTIDASPIPFLGGLFLSRLLVCYSVAIALFGIGVFVFGLSLDINFLLLGLVLTLGCVAFLGIGLVIAVLSPSLNSFNGIVQFIEIPFVIFSGVFLAVTSFPQWLQWVSAAIPLTHLNAALQKLFFDGVGFGSISLISTEIIVLLAWSVLSVVIGWRYFEW